MIACTNLIQLKGVRQTDRQTDGQTPWGC